MVITSFKDLASEKWFLSLTLGPFIILIAFLVDIYCLGRAAALGLRTLPIRTHRLVCRVCRWLQGMRSFVEQGLDQQAVALDLRCISWTFQTSLEKPVHHSIVKYLVTIPELPDFDPTFVIHCFEALVGCLSVNNGKVVIVEGLGQSALASAQSLSRTFHRLQVTDPTSSVLRDFRQLYDATFSFWADFSDLPFDSMMRVIHILVYSGRNHRHLSWDNFNPSSPDHITLARLMARIASAKYQQTECRKVPRWILRFVIYSLSLDPLPAAPIVADCLKIIAIDLGCNVSKIR